MTAYMLSEATGLAIIRALPKMLPADFDTLGITQEEYDLVAGPHAWRREHMPRIVKTMRALLHGAVEAMAFPPIDLSAEYVAAVIVTVVHPANMMACAIILSAHSQSGHSVIEGATSQNAQIDKCSSRQLHDLCCIYLDKDETNIARRGLAQKFSQRVDDALHGVKRK